MYSTCYRTLIIVLSMIAGSCSTQNQGIINKSSPTQNAYHIQGYLNTIAVTGGTCFFLRYKDHVFLLSAWHCFTQLDHKTQNAENEFTYIINNTKVYRSVTDTLSNPAMKLKFSGNFTTTLKQSLIERRGLDIAAIDVGSYRNFPFSYQTLPLSIKTTINAGDSIVYAGMPIKQDENNRQHQVNDPETFKGVVTGSDSIEGIFTLAIDSYKGCSGSAVYKLVDEKPVLCGLLFNAFYKKEDKPPYRLAQAVDVNQIHTMLDNYLQQKK